MGDVEEGVELDEVDRSELDVLARDGSEELVLELCAASDSGSAAAIAINKRFRN